MWPRCLCFSSLRSSLLGKDGPEAVAVKEAHADPAGLTTAAPSGDALHKGKPSTRGPGLITCGSSANSLASEEEGIPSCNQLAPSTDAMPQAIDEEDTAGGSFVNELQQAALHICTTMHSVDHPVEFSDDYEARSLSVPMEPSRRSATSPRHPPAPSSADLSEAQQEQVQAECSQGLVISDEDTACNEQDAVLLNMLYSNAIVVGDAGNTLMSTGELYYTDQELGSTSAEEPAYSASLEAGIIPLNMLDPGSATTPAAAPHEVQDSRADSCLDDPPPGATAAAGGGGEMSSVVSSSVGSNSTSPSFGVPVTIAGKVVDLKEVLASLDNRAWRAGGRVYVASRQQQQGSSVLMPWVQSLPLPHTGRAPLQHSRSQPMYSVMTSSAPLPGIAEVDDETDMTHSGSAAAAALTRTYQDGMDLMGFLH